MRRERELLAIAARNSHGQRYFLIADEQDGPAKVPEEAQYHEGTLFASFMFQTAGPKFIAGVLFQLRLLTDPEDVRDN